MTLGLLTPTETPILYSTETVASRLAACLKLLESPIDIRVHGYFEPERPGPESGPERTMAKGAKIGFYAVAKGRAPGVYMSWDECEAQITAYAGARYKKFTNAADAEAYVASITAGSRSTASSTVPVVPASATSAASNGRRNLAAETLEDESGWHIVYSDGACKGNGKAGSIAGIGVWWGRNDSRNLAERCPGAQTNNRAELIVGVGDVFRDRTRPRDSPAHKTPLLIKTDSQYSINCFRQWLPKWLSKGFVSSKGDPVKNEGIIRYLSALLSQRALEGQKVHLQYVRGHNGEEGNEGADYLANIGATKAEVPERDWDVLRARLSDKASIVDTRVVPEAIMPSVGTDIPMDDEELSDYAACLLDEEDIELDLLDH